jgi:hypothetical protein
VTPVRRTPALRAADALNDPARRKITRGTMKSILDPSFRYTPSFQTDVSKTFARIRRDHRKDAEVAQQAKPDAGAKVLSMVRRPASGG